MCYGKYTALCKEFCSLNLDAAGNFLCPAAGLSFNAFRTVMDIDAIGTFNVTKVVFDQFMKVCSHSFSNYLYIVLFYLA